MQDTAMTPPKAIQYPDELTQNDPPGADFHIDANPDGTRPTSITTHSTPIVRRVNPPTTHDPTKRPPWKKHKFHSRPPTSDWAVLWPRPASYYCPPKASRLTNWAGCHYIDQPAVFDPEIEGLPDWMKPNGEKEGRLWSGVDRVVEVPGEKKIKTVEDEWKGLKRRAVGGEHDVKEWVEEEGVTWDGKSVEEEGEGEIGDGEKIINTVPHITSLFERTWSSESTSMTIPTPMLSMTTPSLAPTPTTEILLIDAPLNQAPDHLVSSLKKSDVTVVIISLSNLGALIILAVAIALIRRGVWKRRNEQQEEESRKNRRKIAASGSMGQRNKENSEERGEDTTGKTKVQGECGQGVPVP